MSLTVANKITVDWKVEGVNELLKKAEEEDVWLFSEPFDWNRWRLSMELPRAGDGKCGFLLECLPDVHDYQAATSTTGWNRTESFSFSIEIRKDDDVLIVPSCSADNRTFNHAHHAWGWHAFGRCATWREVFPTRTDTFSVRCTITSSRPSPPAKSLKLNYPYNLLDSRSCFDVVFAIQPSESGAFSHITAIKDVLMARSSYFRDLFSSDFCESRLEHSDPQGLLGKPSDPLHGDRHDFSAFEEMLVHGNDIKVSEATPPSTLAEPSVQPQIASGLAQSTTATGSYVKVVIHDCSYSTYYGILFYLYTHRINFLPPTSDYLLADQNEPRKPRDASDATKARDAWLIKKALNQNPPPCNPHAVYRLADRYLLNDLKEIAQGYILRSLTVENVAYEAFCRLSLDYDSYRDKVLQFILENWTAVKHTRAWMQSMKLLEDGQLQGGGALLQKLFDALDIKP